MNALTPSQRDRGLQRLGRLTFGATAGALVAVVAVGYVAAASYAGKAASSSTTAANTTTTDSSSTSASATTSSNSLQPAPQAPTTGSSGSGTVTSGGS